MLHDDKKRAVVLSSLVRKRQANLNDDDAFFDSLDKPERLLLTNIHFGVYKVSDEEKKILTL